jgi:hypothetical protein
MQLIIALIIAATPIGTNLYSNNDYNTELPWQDAWLGARAWVSSTINGPWDDGRVIDTDTYGWVKKLAPGQIAKSMVYSNVENPVGDYKLTYEGRGKIVIKGGTLKPDGTIKVTTPGYLQLQILETDSGDYIRNIHIWWPDAIIGDIWNPRFLESLKGYEVLRFMNWLNINSLAYQQSSVACLGDISNAHWSKTGVPMSVMLDLCDHVGAKGWFNIHHLANDTYIRAFLAQIGNRECYIEYSNEIWNPQYKQSQWCGITAVSLGLDSKPWPGKLYYQAQKTQEIIEIRDTLGFDKMKVVIGSQAANQWVGNQLLRRCKPDYLAIAPYFSIENPTWDTLADIAIPQSIEWVRKNLAVAKSYKVGLIAYEGGQHLINYPGAEDWGMYAMYRIYLDAWYKETDGALMVHFTNCSPYGKYGDWGTFESYNNSYCNNDLYPLLRRHRMRKAFLLTLVILTAGCASTLYEETRIDADGSSYTYKYKATDANPLGKTETASKDFSYNVGVEGDSKVSTGQSFQGMDNTPAGAAIGTLTDALIRMSEIKVPATVVEPLE